MNAEELRAAASSASTQAPAERDSFIKNSYQTATIQEIELIKKLADKFTEPCKYNRGFTYEI